MKIKKEKRCQYCNEIITSGHRVDRCQGTPSSKIRRPNNNLLYVPSKYSDKTFERIETKNAVLYTISGAGVANGVSEPVSMSVYRGSLLEMKEVIEKKLKETEPNS